MQKKEKGYKKDPKNEKEKEMKIIDNYELLLKKNVPFPVGVIYIITRSHDAVYN
jgi:hypothetical protein